MLEILLVTLVLLWFLGYVHISGVAIPNVELFAINGQEITLWNILILFVIATAIGILPRPFREIGSVFLVLWILAVLGILSVGGLSSMLVLAMIVGLLLYIVGGERYVR